MKELLYIFNKKDKWKIILLVIAVIAGSIFELMGVTIFMPFTQIIMNPSVIKEEPLLAWVYKALNLSSTEGFLAALAGIIIFIYVFKNIFIALEKNAIYKFSYQTQRKISTRLLSAYMREPYVFHLNKNIAVLQRSILEDTDLFTKGIIHVMEMIAEIMVCIAIGIYLFIVSQSITAIVLVLLVICVGIFTAISRKHSKTLGRKSQEYKGALFQWMNQSLGGVKEIKVLNRESYFIESFDGYFKKYVYGLRVNRLIGVLPKYVVETVCMTGLLVAVIIKLFLGQKDILEFIPQLAVFAVAAFRLLPSVGKINEHLSAALYSAPSLELIYHDLKEIEDCPDQKHERNEEWSFKDKLQLRKVSYHYPDSEEMVIDKADLTIKKGTTTAFIGSSGAGKTTIVDLLLGLLHPQFGKIFADDLDINKHTGTWQKEIGYIPQVIYLSDDTIRNNIAFGIKEEEVDDEAVMRAAKQAQLYEFVDNLPDGINTFVGDRGVRLSGGQRQRIGIARALYHEPEILVLDEATSALDNETETAVMEAIEELHGTKTILIIAHRLTTIRNADFIYEISDGKAVLKSKEEIFGE